MTLNTFGTREEAIAVLARYFVQTAQDAIREDGFFSVALSGGSSPRALYEMLAGSQFRDKVIWNRICFFFGDERYVPATDATSNYGMAKASLLDPLSIAQEQIFRVDTSLPPEDAADNYQQRLFDFFKTEEPRFDLVLLGLGDNAHTASLFPGTSILQETKPGVSAVWVEAKQTWRISFNAPLINEARHIAFLVFGPEKAAAMQHVFSGDNNANLYPAQLIRKEHTAWFTDEAATALLPAS